MSGKKKRPKRSRHKHASVSDVDLKDVPSITELDSSHSHSRLITGVLVVKVVLLAIILLYCLFKGVCHVSV